MRWQRVHLGTLGILTVEGKGQLLRSQRSDFNWNKQDGDLLTETHLTSTGISNSMLQSQRKNGLEVYTMLHPHDICYVFARLNMYINLLLVTFFSLSWCISVAVFHNTDGEAADCKKWKWRTDASGLVFVNSPKEMFPHSPPFCVCQWKTVFSGVIIFYFLNNLSVLFFCQV